MKRSIFTLSILFLFVIARATFAQVGSSPSDIEVSMYPETPAPNESVTVSVVSYITDINSADITWILNGQTSKSGKGLKTYTFNAGADNTTTVLTIRVKTGDGQTIENTLRIKPTSVDLVWQSESYTPPFYKGKALFSFQNKITFIALPHLRNSSGAEISPKNLIYTWKKNGSVQQNDSGFGKNTFTVQPSVIARQLDISVEVTSQDSSSRGFAMISANPTDPFILFYKKSPVYGIEFQKALSGTEDLKDNREITVVGIPFFFGVTEPWQNLSYKWAINGKQIDSDLSQTTRIFRQTEGTSGKSNISLSITHGSKILQYTSKNFYLQFNSPSPEQTGF